MTANAEVIRMWATRDKCLMCKHKFDKSFILPVDKPVRGEFQPNFNVEAIFHLSDTHGIPHDISRRWITGSIYGLELHDFGARGLEKLYNDEGEQK